MSLSSQEEQSCPWDALVVFFNQDGDMMRLIPPFGNRVSERMRCPFCLQCLVAPWFVSPRPR